MEEISNLSVLNIQHLPEEVFEIIAGFLSERDLNSCFSVCRKWRRILNNNKFWKKCCRYPEKYFELSSNQVNKPQKSKTRELCEWRNRYLLQKDIWENWRRGTFVTDKTGIYLPNITCLVDLVDEHGNHWLFDSGQEGITIWNITTTPVFHSKYNEKDHFEVLPLHDKVLTCRSNYVKVFQFEHPEYELKLNYRFKFERSEVLPVHEVVPEDDYMSGVRYILVDNKFFIGYTEYMTNFRSAVIHIWDLNSGNKIATQSVFQQSFVNLIKSVTEGATVAFKGGLSLFAGDNKRFLVNLVDDRFKLCHISLFSLVEMRFMNVVAQLRSRTAWCKMKGDVVVVNHILRDKSSEISVYNINGHLLARIGYPGDFNPAFTDELWFDGCKVIFKVEKDIHTLTIEDNGKVCKNNFFKLDKERFILKYFDPKFLLLYDRGTRYAEWSVSVWDIDSGVKLWSFRTLSNTFLYRQMLNKSEYPGRLLVHFKGDREISILNFEQHEVKENTVNSIN